MCHIIEDIVFQILLDTICLRRIETRQRLILLGLMRRRKILVRKPVAPEHSMNKLQIWEFLEHTAEKLPAKGRRLIDYTTKFPAQIREFIDGLPINRQWCMMHNNWYTCFIQHLKVWFKRFIIQI